MIKPTRSYQDSTGAIHATIEAAQAAEINVILKTAGLDQTGESAARVIVENREKVVDILTTTATSKPTARKVNGGTKTRKPKVMAEATA